MRKLSILLAMLIMGTVLLMGTVLPGVVGASGGYVDIVLNGDLVFDSGALEGVSWQYDGIGEFDVQLIDDKTLRIQLESFNDFLRLFAPPGFSSSTAAQAPAKTILEDMFERINDANAVTDSSGSAVTITLDDVTLINSFGYDYVKVTVMGQDTYEGEDYNVRIDVTGEAFIIGWRNNRGTIKVDDNDVSVNFYGNQYTPVVLSNGTHTLSVITSSTQGNGYTTVALSVIAVGNNDFVPWGGLEHANHDVTFEFTTYVIVPFNFRNALTGQPLTGVTVKEDGQVIGTLDNGQSLELTKGTHELTFEKAGYWSVTKTIDVQSDMTVSVEMYPDSAAFLLENFPSDLTIPENTIYELTFTLSPIQTSATYNTYLAISGLPNVLEVRKDGSVISEENGKYYLGDISGPTQVSIKFKAGSVGQHGFTITLTSNDAIMSKTYTTTKQVTYTVEPLPFSVQMPSEWQVGTNELRISESSGQSYLITAVLKDSQGNEVWSESHNFDSYEAYTFNIEIPAEGSYTLELQWNGQTAVYDITVNPAITLVTRTLTVSEGGEGVITLHFKNPSSDVQYYTIKVSGGFLPAEINQSISVAPLAEKDVSIAFAVPEDLTYDAYELNVAVMQGDSVVFQDKVAVSISEGSGFSLFGGGSSSKTLYYGLAVLVGLGLFIAILRRR